MGPVVDVVFEDGNLPEIKDALEVENNGKRCVMEVSHHLGNNMVRCIMLSASEGLQRDREVIATGSGIKVPVGDKTLGRLFNVLGDTVDDGPSLEGEQKWVPYYLISMSESGNNSIVEYAAWDSKTQDFSLNPQKAIYSKGLENEILSYVLYKWNQNEESWEANQYLLCGDYLAMEADSLN